jgi:hypothetical protein
MRAVRLDCHREKEFDLLTRARHVAGIVIEQ